MRADPIAGILSAQDPEGFWDKPGAGYGRKYTGTVWSLIFLDQFGADGTDPRIQAACRYVLDHTQTSSGGFGATGALSERPPPPSTSIHCLHGNLLRSLIAFGWLDDERVKRAVAWEASSITGNAHDGFYASATSGPGFACGVNGGLPCGWGGDQGDARAGVDPASPPDPGGACRDPAGHRLPAERRSVDGDVPDRHEGQLVLVQARVPIRIRRRRAADRRDARGARSRDEPASRGSRRPAAAQQLPGGAWRNEYAYDGKTWVDVDPRGGPSKWVTLRAASFLKAALG